LYGLYLLYLGLPVLMGCPKDKALGYTVVTVLCAIVVGVVIGLVSTAIMWGVGLGSAGMFGRSASWTNHTSGKADTAAAASDLSGERGEAMGMQTSHATAHYRDGAGGSIKVEIADLGSMSGLAGLAIKFNPNVEKETDNGYERTTTVNGQLLHEQYNRTSKSGELNAIVGNRFSVEVRGTGVDMDTMKKSIAQIDMAKLAAVASAK